jgi:hypothetical protein
VRSIATLVIAVAAAGVFATSSGGTSGASAPRVETVHASGASVAFVLGPAARSDDDLYMTDSPDPVDVGGSLEYVAAFGVTSDSVGGYTIRATGTMPSGVDVVSVTPNQGTCNGTTTIDCDFGYVGPGGLASVRVDVTPREAGTIVAAFRFTGTCYPQACSNGDAVVDEHATTVVQPPAAPPPPVVAPKPVTYADAFSAPGQARPHAVPIPASYTRATIVCRWSKSANRFDVVGVVNAAKKLLSVDGNGRLRPGKLKISTSRTKKSVKVTVSRLRPGTLRFSVKAQKLGGAGKATTTVKLAK